MVVDAKCPCSKVSFGLSTTLFDIGLLVFTIGYVNPVDQDIVIFHYIIVTL